jgi:hypothetical protein
MKKGLILTLLVVALLAIALPAGARAPIIGDIEKIVVGDNEGAVGGMGIIRYIAAFRLAGDVVDWNNDDSYTTDLFHAYIHNATPGVVDVRTCNPQGIIDPLTDLELTALLAAGAMPAASARITSSTADGSYQFLDMSFIDTTRHPAITDPYGADPAVDGVTQDDYAAQTDLTLVCGVTSGTKLVTSSKMITVLCQSSVDDSMEPNIIQVVQYGFTGGADGWTYTDLAPTFTAAPQHDSGTGIGFNLAAAAGGGITFGSWKSPADIAGTTAATDGFVFRALGELESTSASSDGCPGWRMTFANTGFSHYGKISMTTRNTQPTGEVNAPFAGTPIEGKIYWDPPLHLTDMGDAEGQAGGFVGDFRDYKISFDCLGTTGDQGILTLETMTVGKLPRPATIAADIKWGTPGQNNPAATLPNSNGTPFNFAQGGWAPAITPAGFTETNYTISGANIAVDCVGTIEPRFIGVTSQDYANDSNLLKPMTNHLYRFAMEMQTVTPNATPTWRVNFSGLNVNGAAVIVRQMAWAEYYSFCNIVAGGKNANWVPPQQIAPPCCPSDPANPSLVELYINAHSVSTAGVSTIYPLVSIVDNGLFGGTTQWPDANSAMTMTYAGWEDLGDEL